MRPTKASRSRAGSGGWASRRACSSTRSTFATLDPSMRCAASYAIISMETETYEPARLILLGEDATPELMRATSLDSLVTRSSPPFFLWHTAEDVYVPPEH